MLASSLLAPLLLPLASAAAVLTRADKPPAFFLAGDSTTAANGGYGDDFLSFLTNEAWGANYAKSGASTVSFKADGNWAALMKMVHENLRDNQVFVTIEFGHNDQKPELHISNEEFKDNLETMAAEVKSVGGTPIIISPLTRRAFDANGKVIPSLKTQRELAIEASKTVGALFLDLNKASSDYANRLGKEATQKYNRAPGDISHLNTRGSVVFARMVADLVSKQAPALRKYVIPDEGLSGKLASGKPA